MLGACRSTRQGALRTMFTQSCSEVKARCLAVQHANSIYAPDERSTSRHAGAPEGDRQDASAMSCSLGAQPSRGRQRECARLPARGAEAAASASNVRALATGAALAASVDTSPAVLVSIYDYAHRYRDRGAHRVTCLHPSRDRLVRLCRGRPVRRRLTVAAGRGEHARQRPHPELALPEHAVFLMPSKVGLAHLNRLLDTSGRCWSLRHGRSLAVRRRSAAAPPPARRSEGGWRAGR